MESFHSLTYYNLGAQPMFENDPGDKEIRGMVHGWKLSGLYGRAK